MRARSWLPLIGLLAVLLAPLATVSTARAAFGFKALSLTFTEEDGSPAEQAGSHPFNWTTSFALNTTGSDAKELPDGALKDLRIQLPPGLVGTPGLLPQCSRAEYLSEACPTASEVGTIELGTSSAETEDREYPLYNLQPLLGNAAELAFTVQGIPITIDLTIATRPPYNLIAEVTNASQVAAFFGSTLTISGIPGSAPFLTLPRSCAPAPATFEADPWASPGSWVRTEISAPLQPRGCGDLPFSPTLSVQSTSEAAAAPSGLDLVLGAPDEGITSPIGTANADLAQASLVLPPQMRINPALAAGLSACTRAELAREAPAPTPGAGCPQSAKIGTATATTPLLDGAVNGTIFVAEPDDPSTTAPGVENPLDARYAFYLVLRDPERGVLLSLPARLELDPASGQVTTRFEQLPQLPFSRIDLHFNSGAHAPLTTGPACGSESISYSLQPSSGSPPVIGRQALTTSESCARAFQPVLIAGTSSNAAGSASPLVLELSSASREPNPTSLSLTLPPGLSAVFAAIAPCPEAAAGAADCPSDARLGFARIALGTGPDPLWVPSSSAPDSDVYLAGPYHGAPYSLLVRVPANAGPFKLGSVVLRGPIRIDPKTAQATISFENLPQILRGVPLRYRAIRVVIDRPGFIRNPTSCTPTEITGAAHAAGGESAPLSTRFQAADCASLPFSPHLTVRLSGALARNGRPALRAVIKAKPDQTNIARAALTLPVTELLEYANLHAVCTASRYAAGAGGGELCPPGSRYGHARIFTPLFDSPLEGPLYLRSSSNPGRLPDLVASLSGAETRLDFVAHVNSVKGFLHLAIDGLPDVPLEKVVLQLPGGRRGLLVNTADLCQARPRVGAAFLAHNRKRAATRAAVNLNCAPSKLSG